MDTQASTRHNRMRVYEEQRIIPGCPGNTYLFREWLWIDNATEADALLNYFCKGRSKFFSPIVRYVYGSSDMVLSPGNKHINCIC